MGSCSSQPSSLPPTLDGSNHSTGNRLSEFSARSHSFIKKRRSWTEASTPGIYTFDEKTGRVDWNENPLDEECMELTDDELLLILDPALTIAGNPKVSSTIGDDLITRLIRGYVNKEARSFRGQHKVTLYLSLFFVLTLTNNWLFLAVELLHKNARARGGRRNCRYYGLEREE